MMPNGFVWVAGHGFGDGRRFDIATDGDRFHLELPPGPLADREARAVREGLSTAIDDCAPELVARRAPRARVEADGFRRRRF